VTSSTEFTNYFYRINAFYSIIRCLALICLLASRNFKINHILAIIFGNASHYIGTILKMHLISAGVLQLFNIAGPVSFQDLMDICCGIDSEAIW
jgi:hypothetical protein